jgi:hypothetical protein
MNEIYKNFEAKDLRQREVFIEENLINNGDNYSITEDSNDYFVAYSSADNDVLIYRTLLSSNVASTGKEYINYIKFKNILLNSDSEYFFTNEAGDNEITIFSFGRTEKYFDIIVGTDDGKLTSSANASTYSFGESENTSQGERIKITDDGNSDALIGYLYVNFGYIVLKGVFDISDFFGATESNSIISKRKVNQSIHICRIDVDEFNFTNNPLATDENGVYISNFDIEDPTVYITTVGLYDENNELMAIGKFSKPIKKDGTTPISFSAILEI